MDRRLDGEMRNASKSLVRKPEGKRPLRRLWHRWEDNNRMDLKKTSWEVVDWIYLAQDRSMARICEYGNEPSCSIKYGEFLD
jgi:hypothetical protein